MTDIRMRRFGSHSRQHFQGDPRYDLRNVTEGFGSRFDNLSDDTALLERICRAYVRTVSHPQCASASYEATKWWKEIRQSCLGPVIRALQEGDVATLRTAYANFFRDRCGTGLIGVPYGVVKAYFHGPIRNAHRYSYLGDALYRIDYWLSQTGGTFGLADLAGPEVGNPFGVCIDGTLVRSGSEYQHYCAYKILSLVAERPATIGEIGGGYGGVGYYLLRHGERLTYVDFDVPESIALTSYYLLKAFPASSFLLYGEKDLTAEALAASDVVLLPLFEMARMPTASLNLTFSSHTMGDLSDSAMSEYLDAISRMTCDYLLYCGDSHAAQRLSGLGRGGSLRLREARSTAWSRHKAPKASEGEYLYQFERN